MSSGWLITLFAQSTSESLPLGKGVAMVVFFGSVGIISTLGLFASKEKLESMAGIIGTKKPLVARIVCALGSLVGLLVVVVTMLSLFGKL